MQDEEAIAEAERKATSLGFLAADWTFCAVTFILSDILYLGGASSLQLTATLGAIAVVNWKLFDGTKPGQQCCTHCLQYPQAGAITSAATGNSGLHRYRFQLMCRKAHVNNKVCLGKRVLQCMGRERNCVL